MVQASALQAIISNVHDAALDEAQWPRAVSAIAETCGAITGILYEFDIPRWEPRIVGTHRIEAAFLDEYRNHYSAVDPWSRNSVVSGIGRATCTNELISDSDLRRSEFYQDYLRRHEDIFYGLGGVIERTPQYMAILGVQRAYRAGVFDAECFAVIERIMPHLRQAYRVRNALRAARQVCATLSETLHALDRPVLVLDGNARLHFANLAAERLLTAGDGLRLRNGHVTAANREEESPFAEWLAKAARIPTEGIAPALRDCALSRPRSERPLILSFAPLSAGLAGEDGPFVAVLIDTGAAAPPLERLRAALRLSAAEARLLQGLTEGESLAAIAERRQVSVNTLRVQLRQLFQKTGTHRQAELVRFALTAMASGAPET